jgi:hypothetical protein
MTERKLYKNKFTSFWIIEDNGYKILSDSEYLADATCYIEFSPFNTLRICIEDEDKEISATLPIPSELKNLDLERILHLRSFCEYLIKKYFLKS